MAKGKRGRHAQRASRRLRLSAPPTALAIVGLGIVFLAAGALAVHVLNVPAHLRQEGAAGPAAAPGHRSVAAHVRTSESRAARSQQRDSPTPTPSRTTPAGTASTRPAPAPKTTSARPSPRPSPSSTRGPLPLPTLTRPAAD